MKRVERIRLYPTRRQVEQLRFMLDVTRQLYNALLEERREAYRRRRVRVTAKQQYAEITALRGPVHRIDGRLAAVYRECEDAVLHRLELAFQAFFRRLRRGEKPGYPRFRSRCRWSQVEFPHGDRALLFDEHQRRLRVPGVGDVRLRKGREVPPAFGRAWIVERNGRWYGCFECDRAVQLLPATGCIVGVDRGVHVLAATSDGCLMRNPRHLERARHHLEQLQRTVTRRRKGGKSRGKAVAQLARAHERLANARRDALHKASQRLVNSADVVALEALNLRSMTRSAKGTIEKPGTNVVAKAGLNRVLLDASFGLLHRLIVEKAESAARRVVLVDPRYSSQTCSRCGHVAAESRRRRRFVCITCGFVLHADVNAALVIRRRAELRPAGSGASREDRNDLRSALSQARTLLTQSDVA
ncbi:MAG: transposase [Microbacteriaceae bacterium]|nr:MAG: transposase [Microbacteriaceae bacterium]